MGYFSWECTCCKRSITVQANEKKNAPFNPNEAVALLPNGTTIVGEYGGYGDVDGIELLDHDGTVEFRHKWCHENCMMKAGYSKPSDDASDQGYFLDPDVWRDFFDFSDD